MRTAVAMSEPTDVLCAGIIVADHVCSPIAHPQPEECPAPVPVASALVAAASTERHQKKCQPMTTSSAGIRYDA